MNRPKVESVIQEAERFIKKAKAALEKDKIHNPCGTFYSTGTRESGAMRRASLDLSQALEELRKP